MGRPDKVTSVLLDASALIGYIKGEPAYGCLKSLFAAVDRGEVALVESTAILTEVLPVHDDDTNSHAESRTAIRDLLESPTTQLVDVSTPVARMAADFRLTLNMKTWDAVHLATAVLAKVDVLIVRDGKFPEGHYMGVYVTGPFDIDEDKLAFD